MKHARRVVALVLVAGVVWLIGLLAVGIWNEDACLLGADGFPSASGYTQSVRTWPPALVCDYTGSDPAVVHPIRGLVILGWTYVVPVLIGAGLVVWVVAAPETPRFSPADRTAAGR